MTDNPYKYPYVPIGGIIEWDGTGLVGAPDLSTPEKVAAVYGYSTWERYGTDRVTVGAGGEYAAGSTGGEKNHMLTVEELADHSHRTSNYYPGYPLDSALRGQDGVVMLLDNIDGRTESTAHGTKAAGGNQPHNNMQPYIAAYRYRRIA